MSNAADPEDLVVRLTIRGQSFELSTEGTIRALTAAVPGLIDFAGTLSERLPPPQEGIAAGETAPSPEELQEVTTADMPAIKPKKSTSENIMSLFATPWGRTPRIIAEVAKALEVNAVPDRIEAVSTHLIRLVRRGELRRIQKEGKWGYFRIPPE